MMRNEQGYAQIFFADDGRQHIANLNGQRIVTNGSMYESSTFTCCHCSHVVHVPPKADVNFVGMCHNCMKPICQECSGKACEPFERKLEREEARGRFFREIG